MRCFPLSGFPSSAYPAGVFIPRRSSSGLLPPEYTHISRVIRQVSGAILQNPVQKHPCTFFEREKFASRFFLKILVSQNRLGNLKKVFRTRIKSSIDDIMCKRRLQK
nr:MAG TPA: hypothetical protein [Caudoviricetes sp.]